MPARANVLAARGDKNVAKVLKLLRDEEKEKNTMRAAWLEEHKDRAAGEPPSKPTGLDHAYLCLNKLAKQADASMNQ